MHFNIKSYATEKKEEGQRELEELAKLRAAWGLRGGEDLGTWNREGVATVVAGRTTGHF